MNGLAFVLVAGVLRFEKATFLVEKNVWMGLLKQTEKDVNDCLHLHLLLSVSQTLNLMSMFS